MGTNLSTIAHIAGSYASNMQADSLMVKGSTSSGQANSDIARLAGARFVTCSEPNEGVKLNEGLIKQLTGEDRVTARRLYGIENCTRNNEDAEISASELYKAYAEWGNANNEFVISNRKFGAEVGKKYSKFRKSSGQVYLGIELVNKPYQVRIGA